VVSASRDTSAIYIASQIITCPRLSGFYSCVLSVVKTIFFSRRRAIYHDIKEEKERLKNLDYTDTHTPVSYSQITYALFSYKHKQPRTAYSLGTRANKEIPLAPAIARS
jgi:hypothetical protein